MHGGTTAQLSLAPPLRGLGPEVLGMQPKWEAELTPPFRKGHADKTGAGEPPLGEGQISPWGRGIPGEGALASGALSSAQGPWVGAWKSEGLAGEGSPAGPAPLGHR